MREGAWKIRFARHPLGIHMNELLVTGAGGEGVDAFLVDQDPLRGRELPADQPVQRGDGQGRVVVIRHRKRVAKRLPYRVESARFGPMKLQRFILALAAWLVIGSAQATVFDLAAPDAVLLGREE